MNEYLDKLRSVGHIRGGRTWRTKDQVRDGWDKDGNRVKVVTDQGHTTSTYHNNKLDQVDVTVRPETVKYETSVNGD